MRVFKNIKYTNPFYLIGFDIAGRLCLRIPKKPNTET